MNDTILLLAPSRGLGRGIERCLSAIEAAFQQEGVPYRKLALRTLTAFRVKDWRFKGLPTIVEAIRLLGNNRIRLTICGPVRSLPSSRQR